MYRWQTVVVGMLGLLLLIVVAGVPLAAAQQFVTVGTSSVGGSYYLFGAGMATLVEAHLPHIRITAQTTRGSQENMRLLGGRLDMAFSSSAAVWERRQGIGSFEGMPPGTNLRGVMMVDVAPYHWVTLEDTGIRRIEDLAGRTISIGEPGSGAELHSLDVLEAYGLLDRVNLQRLGYSASATALRDGQIVAFVGGSAPPMPAVVDLAATRAVRLLPLADDVLERLIAKNPAYLRYTVPPGTYTGIDEPVTMGAVASLLVADERVPAHVVYEITKLLLSEEGASHMKSVYHAWHAEPAIEMFDRLNVPLHPGAERYYREIGLIP